MTTTGPRLRSLISLFAALLVAGTASVAGAVTEPEVDDPLDILVFSQPYGFSHTEAIVAGAEWFLALDDDPRYRVVVARDEQDVTGLVDDGIEAWEWLRPERLTEFDLVVWNNATGEVPFPDVERDTLRQGVVDFVRDGGGILGIHSAADSNYTWPAFHELIGGQYDGHWYSFGGMEFEPYRLELAVEDPDTPLLAGVDPDYDSHDETYRWQMDVRPDVHVIHSMVNTSIAAQGALYHYAQPITWCREVGGGRSFYTNIGHAGYHFADADYTTMLGNAVEWAGGRMADDVDCSVPVDPATGVAGSDRMGAVWAEVDGARPELSTYSGGLAAVTDITAGTTTITYPQVDLTGVTGIDLFAAAQTIAPATTYGLLGGPTTARVSPAGGGTIEVRLDSPGGPVIASAKLLPLPGLLPTTTLPGEVAPAQGAAGPVASWSVLSSDVATTDGVHDLVLTFAAGAIGDDAFGSLAWIALD